MSKTKPIVLLVAFFLGCAASNAAQLIVPPAHAGTSPQRWEYSCKSAQGDGTITQMANAMGAEGWELAAASANATAQMPVWCYKRALP